MNEPVIWARLNVEALPHVHQYCALASKVIYLPWITSEFVLKLYKLKNKCTNTRAMPGAFDTT